MRMRRTGGADTTQPHWWVRPPGFAILSPSSRLECYVVRNLLHRNLDVDHDLSCLGGLDLVTQGLGNLDNNQLDPKLLGRRTDPACDGIASFFAGEDGNRSCVAQASVELQESELKDVLADLLDLRTLELALPRVGLNQYAFVV